MSLLLVSLVLMTLNERKKNEVRYLLLISTVALLSILAFYAYLRHWNRTHQSNDRVVIRIFPQSRQQVTQLRQMKFFRSSQTSFDFIEVEGRFRDVLELNNRGIPAAIVVESQQHGEIDSIYPNYQEITEKLQSLASSYPDFVRLSEIGRTQFRHLPIYAVKLSRFPHLKEDEPAVLLMAGHHAREAVGIQVCLSLIQELLADSDDPQVRRWLDRMAIWVIPCVNPDGYDYVIRNHLRFPWWRKNLRDNNGDGVFEPEYDGVDLNRNYDFNWEYGGSPKAEAWYYRGISPHSESEVQAVVSLAERERFLLMVDFHSFGETVLYPWGMEIEPPDEAILLALARNLAGRLKKYRQKKPYRTIPLNGRSGQSANWFYAHWRTLALIVEVGPEYFPSQEMLPELLESQLEGVKYLLDRALESGITGHVIDRRTHRPLSAIVQLEDDFSPVVEPTRTDRFGSFRRLLLPGMYSLTVMADGYRETTLAAIKINADRFQRVDIALKKLGDE